MCFDKASLDNDIFGFTLHFFFLLTHTTPVTGYFRMTLNLRDLHPLMSRKGLSFSFKPLSEIIHLIICFQLMQDNNWTSVRKRNFTCLDVFFLKISNWRGSSASAVMYIAYFLDPFKCCQCWMSLINLAYAFLVVLLSCLVVFFTGITSEIAFSSNG